jgi:hypothetical protein
MPMDTQQREKRKKNMALAPIRKQTATATAAAPELTPDAPQTIAAHDPQPDSAENLYLIGRPTLKQFLRFVKDNAIHAPSSGDLVEEWHAANKIIRELEKAEAGLPDNPLLEPVDPSNELLLEFLQVPLVRHSFNTVPTEVAYVDLDRMVVYQHHIDLTHVEQLKRKLGPSPTEEEIFRTCLPCAPSLPPVKWTRSHRDTFVFMSPSDDMRFLGALPLEPDNITDYPPPGNLAGVIGLAVGFGSNFLNAIYAENRLILNNGSHRAYALRDLGITRVPCIVQHVSTRDELSVLACTAVTDAPNFFLQEPRPMMLKDYFDRRLRKVMAVRRRLRQVTVKFDVDITFAPAF